MWSSDDMDTLKQNAFKVCQEYLAGPWLNITCEEFAFSVVSGGLSNRLYLCSLPEDRRGKDANDDRFPNEVLLRIYGPIQESVAILLREAVIFTQFSERKLGPKLYGIFPEGRLEEYIPSQCMRDLDIRKYSVAIAREMAKAHFQRVPISKNPKHIADIIRSWLSFIEEKVDGCELTESNRQLIKKKELNKEMEWLSHVMEKENSPIVFCHNDLQNGNILVKEDQKGEGENGEKAVVLIDYELGGYNYRGFDFANHFAERCFNYNVKSFPFYEVNINKFPTEKEQSVFIEAYLNQMEELGGSMSCGSIQEEKMKILEEVKVFILAPNLWWTIWSLKMAVSASINFAYEEYAETRWNIYQEKKAEFLKRPSCTKINGN